MGEQSTNILLKRQIARRVMLIITILVMIICYLWAAVDEQQARIKQQQIKIKIMTVELSRAQQVKKLMRECGSNNHQVFRAIMDQKSISPVIAARIIKIESEFKVYAVSRCSARGLMQIHPCHGKYSTFDIRHNIRFGCSLLGYYIKKYKNIDIALAAYNAGEGAVKKYHGIPPYLETITYITNFHIGEIIQ